MPEKLITELKHSGGAEIRKPSGERMRRVRKRVEVTESLERVVGEGG